VKGRVQTKSH